MNQVLPPGQYDNDLLQDTRSITAPEAFGTAEPVTVYRARQQGEPVAALFTVIAPDGYSGAIKLLVGVRWDGRLAGVRAVAHRETPGLGDAIEVERSDWITQFAGLSIDEPPVKQWRVKKDGGHFDQFTGATITPRAVVKAIRKALIYFNAHRESFFAPDGSPIVQADEPKAEVKEPSSPSPATEESRLEKAIKQLKTQESRQLKTPSKDLRH